MQKPLSDQYKAPLTNKEPSRVARVPLKPTERSLWQTEGLDELIEGPCSLTECPLRPAQDMVRSANYLPGHYRAFLSQTQA